MKNLTELNNKIKSILPVNTYFTLDDSEQSFVVFPTNHINLTDEFIQIEVGVVIYDNITVHTGIIDNLKELYLLLVDYSDTIEDYASINPVGDTYRLNWGGENIEDDYKDFNNINDLISYLKINK